LSSRKGQLLAYHPNTHPHSNPQKQKQNKKQKQKQKQNKKQKQKQTNKQKIPNFDFYKQICRKENKLKTT
jgi:hypothetical protein